MANALLFAANFGKSCLQSILEIKTIEEEKRVYLTHYCSSSPFLPLLLWMVDNRVVQLDVDLGEFRRGGSEWHAPLLRRPGVDKGEVQLGVEVGEFQRGDQNGTLSLFESLIRVLRSIKTI